jgi:hypothetical protein
MKTQDTTDSALKKLTLRQLTAPELRLVAGGSILKSWPNKYTGGR